MPKSMTMTTVLIVAGMIALVAGWNLFVLRVSDRRLWNPLWIAFTLTAVSLFYGAAGVLGYEVPRHNPFIDHPVVWVGHVVWAQVALASAIALASAFFWWRGLKQLA
jgi:hypothetical protein